MKGASGQLRVPPEFLQRAKFLLPPFAEQQRIVEEIETQFSRLDEAVKALKRVQINLRKLRAATLKFAVEGKLVPTEAEIARIENRDYEPATDLLKRILSERRRKWETDQLAKMQAAGKPPADDKWKAKYIQPAAPDTTDLPEPSEGWTWANLEQISWSANYGTSEKTDYEKLGLPILRIPNVSKGKIDISDLKRADVSLQIEPQNALDVGDFLIIRTNGSKDLLGRGALIKTKFEESYFYASYLIRFRFLGETILHEWISSIWNSDEVRRWIETKAATTAGQYNLNLQILNSLRVPLPPLAEQERIVAEVERRFSIVDELESVLKTNLKRAENLRQKILQNAFSGKLVAQNPTDEPASVLLARITAERARRETEAQEARKNKPKVMKPKNKEAARRTIIEVLHEAANPLTPEQLFRSAGFKPEEVEEFYHELKTADDARKINQDKRADGTVYLTATAE